MQRPVHKHIDTTINHPATKMANDDYATITTLMANDAALMGTAHSVNLAYLQDYPLLFNQ